MSLWHPKLSEINACFETKTKEFAKKENRNPNCDSEAWLQKYIYTNIHEVFFAMFPLELHSCLARLANCSRHIQSDKPTQWNQATVQRLKNTNNVVSRAVNFWLTSLLSRFITEFIVDTLKAYSEAECQFLNSLNLWITMLLCDKGVL